MHFLLECAEIKTLCVIGSGSGGPPGNPPYQELCALSTNTQSRASRIEARQRGFLRERLCLIHTSRVHNNLLN